MQSQMILLRLLKIEDGINYINESKADAVRKREKIAFRVKKKYFSLKNLS